MRVPTITQYQQQSELMTQGLLRIGKLQQQAATGTKIQATSDDPSIGSQVKFLQDAISQLDNFDKLGVMVQNRMQVIQDSNGRVKNIMSQMMERLQVVQSDTIDADEKISIANELQGVLSQMISITNTQDSTGQFVFSGESTDHAPFSLVNGRYTYSAGANPTTIMIGPYVSAKYNDSGNDVFGSIPTGNGTYTVNFNAAQNTGSAMFKDTGIANANLFVNDQYTISFVTNSQGQLAYQVTGASTGQVVPAPPSTIPADAPTFQADQPISWPGVSLQVSGSPNAGDTFTVAPSKNDNILNTFQDLITLLHKPVNTPQDEAVYHQALSTLVGSFDQAASHFLNYTAEVGIRSSTVNTQIDQNKRNLDNQTIILGKINDCDIVKVASDLTQNITSMQIMQESYSKIQQAMMDILRM